MKNKPEPMTIEILEDFAHWINNNWFEPVGSDGMWRLNENAEKIPHDKHFSNEDLVNLYLKDGIQNL